MANRRLPRVPETAYFTVAPDWVCEILSPSTARLDRDKKLRIYAAAGVTHAWLLDPVARTLEVLCRIDLSWAVIANHAGGQTVHAEPFEAADLRLGWLWDDD